MKKVRKNGSKEASLFDETSGSGGKSTGAVAVAPAPATSLEKAEKPRKETPEATPRERKPRASAESMATKQRDISVSEFFTKNRHLLGFDNPRKALLTAVKEAVDNSLDACEEAGIFPEVTVEIRPIEEERYRIAIEDNGPGIVKAQVPKVFGKLLYGSKFHTLKQQRGQQGIGISAAGMYGHLTTGKPTVVISRPGKGKIASRFEITIDTNKNMPVILKEEEIEWPREHGTRVEIELEGIYQKGDRSVDAFLKQVAIANPHVTIHYMDPTGERLDFSRAVEKLPPELEEIKPHPYGVELGLLIKMLQGTSSRWLNGFLQEEFSRVGAKTANDICEKAGLNPHSKPKTLAATDAEKLHKAIQQTKIISPPTTCIAPIGEAQILAGLKKEVEADFYTANSRPPAVYRGNPFLVEVGLAYGKPGASMVMDESGKIMPGKTFLEEKKKAEAARKAAEKKAEETGDLMGFADEPIRLLRFANRVPLLFQQSACAATKSVIGTNWRSYTLQQPKGALPVGPMVLFVHIASVWVPFTSESKEAIASYPEIIKELKLALQDCGRKLAMFVRKGRRISDEFKKRSYIEKYIPHIGLALQEILALSDKERDKTVATLTDTLNKSRKLD